MSALGSSQRPAGKIFSATNKQDVEISRAIEEYAVLVLELLGAFEAASGDWVGVYWKALALK